MSTKSVCFFRHVPKNDLWSSILYHSSNPFSKTESRWEIEKPTVDKPQTFTECFLVNTAKGVQCHRDRILSNNEMSSSSSAIVISIVLSRAAFGKVNTILYVRVYLCISVKSTTTGTSSPRTRICIFARRKAKVFGFGTIMLRLKTSL